MNSENVFAKFSTFIFENADKSQVLEFILGLGVAEENIVIYDFLKIDDVREIKDEAEIEKDEKIAFVIGDLSFDAQNALLKLTEETSDGVYFAFYKTNNLLDTIYSRAQVIYLDKKFYVDELFVKALDKGDKASIVKFLFSLSGKAAILELLEFLTDYYSKRAQLEKAKKLMDFFKSAREYNLNERLLVANIFSVIED